MNEIVTTTYFRDEKSKTLGVTHNHGNGRIDFVAKGAENYEKDIT